jgi:hypothetical protein
VTSVGSAHDRLSTRNFSRFGVGRYSPDRGLEGARNEKHFGARRASL